MTTPTIPETMKRLVLTDPGDGTSVQTCKIELQTDAPVPKPSSSQVLIKMVAAPCNPSDYGAWKNASKEQCPMPMGLEGCGVVVATGDSFFSRYMFPVGTKVGVIAPKDNQGTYAEYVCMSATQGVFAIPDNVPLEDAASFFINPYTALAILDQAKSVGSKALIHTAAASQLGQMMNKFASQQPASAGVPEIINVVRRQEQADLLKELGAKHIVVTKSEGWKDELQAKIQELDCKVAFDAVAGDMTGDLIECLPPKSTVYVYGALGGKVSGIGPVELIYNEKEVKGFLLKSWVSKGGMLYTIPRMLSAGKKVNAGLGSGGWSSTQFKDTALDKVQEDIVGLLGSSITGTKLRVRFDKD